MKKHGFTLAEILITLTIIGIVAGLTIPSLINNIGDQQNKIAWKKAYADASLATMRMLADNGGTMLNICTPVDDTCFRDKLLPYLNYVKKCDAGQTFNNCWFVSDPVAAAGMTLNNGTSLIVRHERSTCNYTAINRCAWFMIDVNGSKGPNAMGKDAFGGVFLSDRVAPFGGVQGDGYDPSTSCVNGANNYGCSALYLYQ